MNSEISDLTDKMVYLAERCQYLHSEVGKGDGSGIWLLKAELANTFEDLCQYERDLTKVQSEEGQH